MQGELFGGYPGYHERVRVEQDPARGGRDRPVLGLCPVGQFTHGQISERSSSKHYLFSMMILSALMNLLMIPTANLGIIAMGIVRALNGFFQAGG